MNDTTPEIESKLAELYKRKSGEEKLLICLKMFETAREIVISSLPKNISERELQKKIFLRFYGNDFSENEKVNILNSF